MTEQKDLQAHWDGIARWFDRAPVSKYIGQELVHIGDGVAELRMPFNAGFDQGMGITHGGIVTTLADTSGFVAGCSVVTDGVVATTEMKVNLLAPVRKEAIRARAKVIHRGKSLLVCELKVVTEDEERLVLVGLGTYIIFPNAELKQRLTAE